MKTKKLRIGGMTCINCQNSIEKELQNTAGIKKAAVSYSSGTATVTYDTDIILLKDIVALIQRLDYQVLEDGEPLARPKGAVALVVVLLGAYLLMRHLGLGNIFNVFPLAEEGMGYGMLFVIGLLTSVHCLAMCGGINLSQCLPHGNSLRPGLLYNLGRVCSYTVIGGIVGALGSVISFSYQAKGVVQLIAGVFMLVMGLNMLGFFPWLRRFVPRMPKAFARGIEAQKGKSNSPLYIGLLNGLMPCGPLQAMQLYALSTGSPVTGALSMLLFSLGTTPLMFGLGALSSVLSKKFTHRVLTVGAALVIVLGAAMFSQGLALSGSPLPAPAQTTPAQSSAIEGVEIKDGVQIVKSSLNPRRSYPHITVEVGMPVKWIIDAQEGTINNCNNRILISEYGIEHQFEIGENVIEFTPTETGRFIYSCWMGMINGQITVVESGAAQ